MNVTLKNYRTLDFDVINIQEEWNKPTERENRMHCIHAYPAKFPAFITTMAIQKAEQKNIKVDTFEAVRSGKNFWGCDINPVATLIAKVKSQVYNDAILEEYFDEIVSSFKTSIADKNNIIYANERVKYWFDEAQIDDLLKLRSAIYRNVKNEY